MQLETKGKIPPEFASSHPSPENRINKIKEWMPIVSNKYTAIG